MISITCVRVPFVFVFLFLARRQKVAKKKLISISNERTSHLFAAFSPRSFDLPPFFRARSHLEII